MAFKLKEQALSEREWRFIEAFIGRARGNATEAARMAGYSAKSARRIATRLLSTNVHIQQAIASRRQRGLESAILDADATDRILSTIAQTSEDVHARIRAISELNKVRGRHSIKHVADGHVTLEMLLAESRGMKLVAPR
jgi:phage terminase small subunit